jgi:hypothetical protein
MANGMPFLQLPMRRIVNKTAGLILQLMFHGILWSESEHNSVYNGNLSQDLPKPNSCDLQQCQLLWSVLWAVYPAADSNTTSDLASGFRHRVCLLVLLCALSSLPF